MKGAKPLMKRKLGIRTRHNLAKIRQVLEYVNLEKIELRHSDHVGRLEIGQVSQDIAKRVSNLSIVVCDL